MAIDEMTLGDVADYINGRAFKPEEWEETGKPIIRIQNLTNSTEVCNRTTNVYEDKYLVHDGDLLFAWSASLGAHIWKGEDGWLNQHIFKVQPKEFMDKMYLFYYLEHIVGQLYAKTHGSGMVHITLKPFKSTKIQVPSLDYQRRIVAFLDREFSRLDKAKGQIQSVLDSSEERKQSILHKAVTGELSAKWRKDNGYSLNKWSRSSINDVCKDVKVGIVIKPTRYYTGSHGIPAFRSANVREFYVQDSDWVYISEQGQKDNQRTVVHTNDVLIVRSGNPGTACVVPEKFDGCNAIDIIIAVPNQDMIYPEYLCIFTNSPIGRRKVQSGVRGMALTHFNVTSYGKLKINVPSLEEQHEIVRMVKRYLENDKKVRDAASAALEQLEETRKSILSKAFRGELIR